MRRTAILIVAACSLWLAPMPAAAEPYAGLFAGAAFSERNDVDDVLAGTFTMKDVSFDTSAVFGGKAGYFFDRPIGGGNLGLELEVYHFRPDVDTQDVNFSFGGFRGEFRMQGFDLEVTPIVLNGLYRLPLARSDEIPGGRFHPYVGAGVGAFIANLKGRTLVLDTPTTFDDTDAAVGFQGLAGLRFFLTLHVAAFAEYKYVRTLDFTFTRISDVGTFNGSPTIEVDKVKFHLNTHMLQAGFAYHW